MHEVLRLRVFGYLMRAYPGLYRIHCAQEPCTQGGLKDSFSCKQP